MNRKPIFDTVRRLLGRSFTKVEVTRLDAAIDLALARQHSAPPARLGALSERHESGGRGPGAVSSGAGDPGGVSYGTYQLSSKAGTVAAFLRGEGAPWQAALDAPPGSPPFSAAWKAIAARDPDAFAAAQHAFIKRSHYDPVLAAVLRQTGFDLDLRHSAVRDAVWSVAVQHGKAAQILIAALARADAGTVRGDPGFDRALIDAIYAERSAYVSRLAASSAAGARRTLESVVRHRYPAERTQALAMLVDGEIAAGAA